MRAKDFINEEYSWVIQHKDSKRVIGTFKDQDAAKAQFDTISPAKRNQYVVTSVPRQHSIQEDIEIPSGKSRRVTVPVPRYWYHSLRGRTLGPNDEIFPYVYGKETGIFRNELYRDPKPTGFVYLSPRPLSSDAIKIDISKLDTSLMRLTGQVEGYAVYGGAIPKDAQVSDELDEMALAKYQPMGDFDKPGPFRGADKKLVPHPKSELKTQQFFEQTPYDFRLFFSNIPGTGKYSEHGPMSPEKIREVFKDRADEIIDGSEDAITVVFVGNKGDAKVILTPWMMAHRLGHAIAREYAVGSRGSRDAAAWYAAEKHFFENINSILKDYYGIYAGTKGFTFELADEYNSLFNAIGTQRSSRQNLIKRPYEFFYELFAQYLGTGNVKMNPLPMTLGYGRKAWGRSTKAMNVKPEYRDQADLARVTDVLGHDMEIMFSDVLSNAEGKIFVM